jgi:uncharacterized protein (TIGR01777 family)
LSGSGSVVVTGATGLIGRRLVAALSDSGRGVRALSRDATAGGFGPGVAVVSWNGLHVASETLVGAAAVVHLAGEPVFAGRLNGARRRRLRESRIESARSIANAIAALPEGGRPGTFVCASAVGYYGSRGDEELDEAAGPGSGFLADLCVDWEEAARSAEEYGTRVVCLRIGIVLAREGGALPRLALPFRFGLGGRLGDGRQWFPWVHADDVVGIVEAALADPAWRGAVNAVAPELVTNAELTHAVGRALHRPSFLAVPAFALRAALGEDLAVELLGSRRVLPRAALDRGYAFAHPRIEPALARELPALSQEPGPAGRARTGE